MRKRAKTGGGLFFFLKEGLSNLFLNGFMTFAAISIIAVCILIVSSFSLTALNINREIVSIREESQIMVFLNEELEADSKAVEEEILAVPDVSHVIFISKEQALDDYKLSFGDNAKALEGLEDDNPLRDGFTIFLTNLDNIDTVTENLGEIVGHENVSSRNATLNALNSVEDGFSLIAVVLVLALGGVSIFIISNTVKLAMFARRQEIAIMKMIGATNAFIRWPFVVEGLVLGVLGALVAFGAQWLIYNEFALVINEYIGFVELLVFSDIYLYALGGFMGVGVIIGVFGSLLTIRKFLDV